MFYIQMQEDIKNKIVQIATAVIGKMGVDGSVRFSQEGTDEKQLGVLSVESSMDSGVLIGKNGVNLEALEHIVRAILSREEGLPRVNFILDVNDYRKIRTRHLTETAKGVAERVISTAKAEALEPMTSYERRLVHMELASYNNIATESIGEEPKRRIVIKPL